MREGDRLNLRKRIFLPQQFGRASLINSLLFAFRSSTSLAAVHYFGTLHLVIPGSRQDIMGCAFSVLHHTCNLETPKKTANRKRYVLYILKAMYIFTEWISPLKCCSHHWQSLCRSHLHCGKRLLNGSVKWKYQEIELKEHHFNSYCKRLKRPCLPHTITYFYHGHPNRKSPLSNNQNLRGLLHKNL